MLGLNGPSWVGILSTGNLEEQILTHKGCYEKNLVPYNSRTTTTPQDC